MHRSRHLPIAFFALMTLSTFQAPAQQESPIDWGAYLGGPRRNQYSELDQINRENVGALGPVWTYFAGDKSPANRSQIQCNPIVIDGVLYATSPSLKLFALNAATGERIWQFSPFDDDDGQRGVGVNRGVSYWAEGQDKRILYTAGPRLYAVDATTGLSIESFGEKGSVDLHTGLGERAKNLFVGSNTPGAIFGNLLILGTRVSESLPAAPGHVRAFNVRTGEIAWTFRTIPRPGEFGYETWPADAWKVSGGANSWAGMSVDHERGLVFVPTGSAAYDFYGGDRHGANLFANCLLALNARTGERVWHFQIVHHDLWDRDLPAPPNLVTVVRDGRRIDAVAQITKSAYVFLFDRETGKPLFEVAELPAPRSDLEGEQAWPSQPFPVAPPPFARQTFTEAEVTNLSPEARDYVLERLRRSRSRGQYIPPSRQGTIVLPGFDGGGQWGGSAFDRETGMLYVNSSEMAWILTLIDVEPENDGLLADDGRMLYAQHCLYCHGVRREGDPLGEYPPLVGLARRTSRAEVTKLLEEGKGKMPSFAHLTEDQDRALMAYLFDSKQPAPESAGDDGNDALTQALDAGQGSTHKRFTHTGYTRFLDQDGYPALRPPWGTLNAIDLNKGTIVWRVPLGETPELAARGIRRSGTENYGGPIVTAGGLVFIAATKDEKIRAFEKTTGELLWEMALPAGGYATPSTYAVDGKQYVVIAAGGGKMGTKSGDAYVAFALPD